MLNPWIKIKINKFVFTYCQSVSITKSYVGFTDTAEILMPNVLYQSQVNGLSENLYNLIKRTDPEEIWMGDRKYISELNGFVNAVQNDDVIKISCENYAFALKQVNVVSKIFRSATLKQVIDHIFADTNINIEYGIAEDTALGDIAIENQNFISALQVLEHLQEKYIINSFFNGKTLVIGQFTEKTGSQKNLLFEANIVGNNLEYITEENMRLVVKGVSQIPGDKKDTKIIKWISKSNDEWTITDTEQVGETRTMTFYNLTEDQLIEKIKAEYNRYNYTGFNGGFTTFIKPSINPSDSVYFRSLKFAYKTGEYKVRNVTKSYDNTGAFQKVEIDYKLR